MKPRHIPLRTCVICREKQPKRGLTRVVRTPGGEVALDASGKLNGRGAYVCADGRHWGDAQIRARLGQALKATIAPEDIERLGREAGSLARASTNQDS